MSDNLVVNILALSLLAQFALYFSDHGVTAVLLSLCLLIVSCFYHRINKEEAKMAGIMSILYMLICTFLLIVLEIASLPLVLMSGLSFASNLIWWHQGLRDKQLNKDLMVAYHWMMACAIVLLGFALVLPCENMIMAQYYQYALSVRLSMIMLIVFIFSPSFMAYGYSRYHKNHCSFASHFSVNPVKKEHRMS